MPSAVSVSFLGLSTPPVHPRLLDLRLARGTRSLGLAPGAGRDLRREDGALEDLGRQVDRDARVRYVHDAADPALNRGGPEDDVGLLVGVAVLLAVRDAVQAGLPVGLREVQLALGGVLRYPDAVGNGVAGVSCFGRR